MVQHISVLQSENQAHIANISAGAEAKSKEIKAAARRDAFNLKQGMKAKKLLGGLKQRVFCVFVFCGLFFFVERTQCMKDKLCCFLFREILKRNYKSLEG